MLHRWKSIGVALIATWIGCSAAIAQDASRITSVTLYPGSATVERSARVVPGMTRLEISGLPANFDPQTVRVESDAGVRIGEVSTRDQSRTAASNARESAIEERIQALKDRQAVLEVDAKSAQMAADYIARLGAPAAGSEKPAPALNGKSVAEVIEAVRRGGSDAFGRIQKVQVQKREIDKEIRALERDLALGRGAGFSAPEAGAPRREMNSAAICADFASTSSTACRSLSAWIFSSIADSRAFEAAVRL